MNRYVNLNPLRFRVLFRLLSNEIQYHFLFLRIFLRIRKNYVHVIQNIFRDVFAIFLTVFLFKTYFSYIVEVKIEFIYFVGFVEVVYFKPDSNIFTKIFIIQIKIIKKSISNFRCFLHTFNAESIYNFIFRKSDEVFKILIAFYKSLYFMRQDVFVFGLYFLEKKLQLNTRVRSCSIFLQHRDILCSNDIASVSELNEKITVLLSYFRNLNPNKKSSEQAYEGSKPTTQRAHNGPKPIERDLTSRIGVERKIYNVRKQIEYGQDQTCRYNTKNKMPKIFSNPSHTTNMRRFSFARQLGMAA